MNNSIMELKARDILSKLELAKLVDIRTEAIIFLKKANTIPKQN